MTRRQSRTGRSTRTPSRPWRRPRGALAVILSLAMVVGMVPQGALAEAADQLAAATEQATAEQADESGSSQQADDPSSSQQADDPSSSQQAATEQADESGSSQQADDPSSSQETATEQESEATDGTEPGSEQVTTQGTAESESDASAEEADQDIEPVVSSEQSEADQAAALAAAQPLDAVSTTTQSSGAQLVSFQIHKGSPTGEVVADLVSDPDSNVNWAYDAEYYVTVQVKKENVADDCWVSLDIPWFMEVKNPEGGSSWSTAGADISSSSTSFDRVLSYTAATGGSSVVVSKAGKVYYHIKNTTDTAQLQFSMYPMSAYYNRSGAEVFSTHRLSVACGDMSGEDIGSQSQELSASSITVTGSGRMGLDWKVEVTVSPEEVAKPTNWITGQPSVITEASFDVVYATGATLSLVTYNGALAPRSETANADGTTTAHYVTDNPAGMGPTAPKINISYPASFNGTRQNTALRNYTVRTYGDELAEPYGFTLADQPEFWTVYVTDKISVSINPSNSTRYDWYGQKGVEQNTRLFEAAVAAAGSHALSSDPYTAHVEYPTNTIVRAITVPRFSTGDGSSTITVNGTEYPVSEAYSSDADYYVFRAQDLGLARIESVTYDVGSMRGGESSRYDAASDAYGNIRLAAWGSVTDGQKAVATYTIWPTADSAKTQTARSTFTPSTNLYMGQGYCAISLGSSQITAGQSTHVTATVDAGGWCGGATSVYMRSPTFYLALPAGIGYANATIGGIAVTGTDITATATGTVPEGTRIYRFECPRDDMYFGVYDADGVRGSLALAFDLLTDTGTPTQTLDLSKAILMASSDVSHPYTAYYGNAADTYGINGGRPLTCFSGGALAINEFKEVEVVNSMTVKANGTPLGEELTYNASDPNNTRAYVKSGFTADYKVVVNNKSGDNANDLKVFIPIPKAGQNFGAAFNPDGAQEYDLDFAVEGVPDGWTVQYVKIASGRTYAAGTVPVAGDYAVVTDPSQADMVLISGPSVLADKQGAEFHFKVTGGDLSQLLGVIDTWNCAPVYTAGSTGATVCPAGYPEALEVAAGSLTGTVYDDANGNGVQDEGEPGLAGVEVTSTDNFSVNGTSYPRTLATTTDGDGNYSFDFVRNTSAEGKNADVEIVVSVKNPSPATKFFSPTTTTGNNPSSVTATADQAYGNKTGIQLRNGANSAEVDAGLTALRANYLRGAHGTFAEGVDNETSFDVSLGGTWPEYAGETDTEATNAGNAGNPKGEPGYCFTGWSPAVSGVISGPQSFVAQWKANDYLVSYVSGDPDGGSVTGGPETVAYGGRPAMGGVAAAPAPGYRVGGWAYSTDVAGGATETGETADPTSVTILGDTTFTARFVADEAQTYDVAYVSAGNGTVDHALDAGIQVLGTDGVSGSTATPAPGYRFEGWYVGGARVDGAGAALGADEAAANVASSGGVRSDTTFTARFVEGDAVTLAYGTDGTAGCAVSPAGESVAPDTGAAAGSTATAAPGYYLVGWTNDLDGTETADATLSPAQVDAVARASGTYVATTFTAHFAACAPAFDDLSVTKVVSGDVPARASTFSFRVSPVSTTVAGMGAASMPMPGGVAGADVVAAVTGAGVARLGRVSFAVPGTYVYEVSEVAGADAAYTYDRSVYTVTYEVTQDGGALACARTITRSGVRADAVSFDNAYAAPAATAQTYAATPLTGDATPLAGLASLATVGLAAVALGLRRRRGRSRW